ncbi:Metallo-dependent phosphatase [Trichodelitschia bisporula]|uniref:Metallo-dependent phosphatase n=1 Tax=Trichodelitschia bisporula TaxID=703511 RepID=A0A6G1HHT7_9PEZI|nr:Metallo-dependent phosphatase [Trichodelitschia bisporula]
MSTMLKLNIFRNMAHLDPLTAQADFVIRSRPSTPQPPPSPRPSPRLPSDQFSRQAEPNLVSPEHLFAHQFSHQGSHRGSVSDSPPPLDPLRPRGKLYAISDLHLAYKANRDAWNLLAPHPDDGLILAGDVGESLEHLELAFSVATRAFRAVWWVPGNHELYTQNGLRGTAKYAACVAAARAWGVRTPEDGFEVWEGEGGSCVVCPVFALYDYSWAPEGMGPVQAVEWAGEEGVRASDEALLHPEPYASRQEWCQALVNRAEGRLAEVGVRWPGLPVVIVNHWPLRRGLVSLFKVPRFIVWCGTTRTEGWHERFRASVVVSGHIHVRRTDWVGDTRFEEVSWGYPRQWKECADRGVGINEVLREIWPGPEKEESDTGETQFRWYG